MSNEVQVPYYAISNTIYMVVRDNVSKVWNVVSEAFEIWDDSSIANYVANATYKGGLLHSVVFPSTIADGTYTAIFFIRSGLTPVLANDIWIGSGVYLWDITTQTLSPAGGSSGGSTAITFERSPKVQVKRSENVTVTTVPADVVIQTETVKRTSEAATSQVKRTSSSEIG